MQVEYNTKPEAILYMPLPNGQADVWLRKNITETAQETEDTKSTVWTADEIYFRTSLTEQEIIDNFDAIFENGGIEIDAETGVEILGGITIQDRVEALEDGLADLAEVLMEVIG